MWASPGSRCPFFVPVKNLMASQSCWRFIFTTVPLTDYLRIIQSISSPPSPPLPPTSPHSFVYYIADKRHPLNPQEGRRRLSWCSSFAYLRESCTPGFYIRYNSIGLELAKKSGIGEVAKAWREMANVVQKEVMNNNNTPGAPPKFAEILGNIGNTVRYGESNNKFLIPFLNIDSSSGQVQCSWTHFQN